MAKPKNGKIQCLGCETILESFHRHDFKYCKCGKVFIDGGSDYLRFGWPEGASGKWVKVLQEPDNGEKRVKPKPVKEKKKKQVETLAYEYRHDSFQGERGVFITRTYRITEE